MWYVIKHPQKRANTQKHLISISYISIVSLSCCNALRLIHITQRQRKTSKQHVNLANEEEERSFPGCSRAVPLCLSGVSSWSPQEFFCLRIKTTSKHVRPPECVVPAFRGLSASVMIPGSRLHANIPKGECTPTCRLWSVCVNCPRF